jgi:hypothetical protein
LRGRRIYLVGLLDCEIEDLDFHGGALNEDFFDGFGVIISKWLNESFTNIPRVGGKSTILILDKDILCFIIKLILIKVPKCIVIKIFHKFLEVL